MQGRRSLKGPHPVPFEDVRLTSWAENLCIPGLGQEQQMWLGVPEEKVRTKEKRKWFELWETQWAVMKGDE